LDFFPEELAGRERDHKKTQADNFSGCFSFLMRQIKFDNIKA